MEAEGFSREGRRLTQNFLDFVAAFVFGILTVGLAFLAQKMGTLVQMANTVFGCIGGPLLGVFSLGVLYRRANSG